MDYYDEDALAKLPIVKFDYRNKTEPTGLIVEEDLESKLEDSLFK